MAESFDELGGVDSLFRVGSPWNGGEGIVVVSDFAAFPVIGFLKRI